MLMDSLKYCRIVRSVAIILLFLIVLDEFYVYVYQLWDVFDQVLEYYEPKDYFTTFSSMFITAYALLYLAIRRPNDMSKILTVCVMVIAYDSIIDAYFMLVEYRDIVDKTEVMTKMTLFLMGVFNLVVSLMLFINAFIYSRGLSKSTTLIRYSVIALLLVIALSFIADFRSGLSFIDILKNNRDTLPLFFMLIFIMVIISSKSVKLRTTKYIISSSIDDLRNSMVAMGLGIERNIALRLSDYNKNGLWCDSYSFILTTYYRDDYVMTMQRLGDDVLVRISSVDNHTGVNNFRFHVRGIWTDTGDIGTCDLMRFYGEDGLFIQLIVRDPEKHLKGRVPLIGSLMLSSHEQGTFAYKFRAKYTETMSVIREKVKRKRAEGPE